MKSERRQVVGPEGSWEELVDSGLHQTVQTNFQKKNKHSISKNHQQIWTHLSHHFIY